MADREKVIRAVDSCFDYWLDQHRCLNPLELEHVRQYKADALAMLKEQEPVAPVMVPHSLGIAYNCGSCGTEIAVIRDTVSADYVRNNVRYCHRCGKAVKWDG